MKPLFIVGAPRSGTSLTALAFAAQGFWTGKTTSQCENHRIRENVLKPILIEAGMDRLALRSFTDVPAHGKKAKRLRGDVSRVLMSQGWLPGMGPWLYKDCKMVFCWRLWRAAYPDAIWALVFRDPEMIVESYAKRWHLAKNVEFDHHEVVRAHHSRMIDLAEAMPDDTYIVYPDWLIRGDDANHRLVAERCGLEWSLPKALAAIDPEKYHVKEGH